MGRTGRLRAQAVGDLEEARQRNKGGGGDWALTVKANDTLIVRFIDEPHEWTEYLSHFMADNEPKAFPCNDGDCIGCDEGNKPSKKWAARVVDVTESRIRVFVMVKSVWEKLVKKYDRNGTILDRNYCIEREGSGLTDTTYEVEAEDKARMNLRKYAQEIEELDVEEFLVGQIPERRVSGGGKGNRASRRGGDSDRTSRRGGGRLKNAPGRRVPRQRDDDDDVPFDTDDEDERPRRARKPGRSTSSTTGGGIRRRTSGTTAKSTGTRRIPRR